MAITQAPAAFDWKDFWDMAAHAGTVVGLAVGAVWAYFNFVKSRTYYPHVEIAVSGKIYESATRLYLIPRVTLKNLGKSRVNLLNDGLANFWLWTTTGEALSTGNVRWSGGESYPIFERHNWLEPDETIFDELRMFKLPADCIAAKIEARLVIPVPIEWRKRISWTKQVSWRKRIGWRTRKNAEVNCSAVVVPTSATKENR